MKYEDIKKEDIRRRIVRYKPPFGEEGYGIITSLNYNDPTAVFVRYHFDKGVALHGITAQSTPLMDLEFIGPNFDEVIT